jgi:hypothetical protein
MSDTGFIKLYRKLLDNPVVCKDDSHFAVWGYLLLKATWQPYETMMEGKKITLIPGQLITGRKAIAAHFRIAESKVQRILKLFENEHLIEQQTTPRNRLITVLNWCMYQSTEQQDEQQVNNNWTTSEQQVNTNKNIKNIEEEKNKRNNKREQIRYFDFDELNDAFLAYIEMRKKSKAPMSDRAIELAIGKLDKLAKDDDYRKLAIINESILNGWKGLFEYKGEVERPVKPDRIQEQIEKPGTIFIDIEKLMKEGGIDGLDGLGKQERRNW